MKRQAFGMVFAIIIVVLVATLGILGLKLSTRAMNTTTNEHIAIQLDLYLNSTIELAILYIQRNGFLYNAGANAQDISSTKRANAMEPITRKINYGENGEYQFIYKMTPLVDANTAKEDQINTMVIDVSGFVVNPITNQTFRVTKRQIVKP